MRISVRGGPASLVTLAVLSASPSPALTALRSESFSLGDAAEVVATLTASCGGCSWERKGHEAAAVRLDVDGRYSQHVLLTRGAEPAPYPVALGRLNPGDHTVTASLDAARSARFVRGASVDAIAIRAALPGSPEEIRLAHAPILYLRPDSVRRFSDVPLLMWVETDRTERGTRLRYSVVFSNEDGGTPADRLMATWGRLTDIEYVYGVILDGAARLVSSEFQARGHETKPFTGDREANHPVVYVVTKNNMVDDHGRPTIRFAPAPEHADLTGVSREIVMDAAPWTYRVSAQEVRREGRVKPHAVPGSRKVPDPRRFVTLEACASTKDTTLAFAVGVREGSHLRYFDSSADIPEFRIDRSAIHFPTGCFRGAVALPAGITASQIESVRLRAFTRLPGKDEKPLPRGAGDARLVSIKRLFFLDERDEPGPNLLEWQGDVRLVAEGPAYEIPVGAGEAASR